MTQDKVIATVWDGEIAGLERGLRTAGDADQVLLLADSKAAIRAVVAAGETGKARTRALGALGGEIKRRKDLYGDRAVRLGWLKSHIGIAGNEGADEMAKLGATKESGGGITEGGVHQRLQAIRKENRAGKDFLCVAGWDRHMATTYSHLRTNKGNLQAWRYRIGKVESPLCRFCNQGEETGEHIVFKCAHWDRWRVKKRIDGAFRTWENWEDLTLSVWMEGSEGGKECVDLVKRFLSKVDLL